MSTISLRLPDSLHKQVRKLAAQESVSINQLITLALAEKLSALVTEDYLQARGERGRVQPAFSLEGWERHRSFFPDSAALTVPVFG
jgi:predicted transcriptional regulator